MTVFYYPMRWTGTTLEPGDYEVTFTLDVNGNIQTFKDSISIKNEEIVETQEKMEERGEIVVAPKTFPWTTVIIGLLVLVIVVLIFQMNKKKPKR